MNKFLSPAVLLSGLALAVQTLTASAAPLADRLERDSLHTALAIEQPLTDVQKIGDQLVMVGAAGHILLRSPSATSQAKTPVDLLLTAVYFVDARNGWAVGHDGVILHSSDGGNTWARQLEGRAISQLMLKWAEAEVARLEQASAAAPEDEKLLTALDNANFALDDAKAGVEAGPSRPLLDVWFRDAQEGWAVGAYGMIVHTRDGGSTWEFLSGLDNPERLHLNAVLGTADGSLLVAGEGGRMYRQSNGQWQTLEPQTKASLYKLMSLRDGKTLAMGFGGALYVSEDQGLSWQNIALTSRASLYGGTQLNDGAVVLTGSGGTLFYSNDLEHFSTWHGSAKSPLLGAAQLAEGQLALIGSNGLRVLPLADIKEQLQ
jgi:photosystem II stability/assembly factor-like uncharacterized protein